MKYLWGYIHINKKKSDDVNAHFLPYVPAENFGFFQQIKRFEFEN